MADLPLTTKKHPMTSLGEHIKMKPDAQPVKIKRQRMLPQECFPRDFEILGWYPSGPVLPYGEMSL